MRTILMLLVAASLGACTRKAEQADSADAGSLAPQLMSPKAKEPVEAPALSAAAQSTLTVLRRFDEVRVRAYSPGVEVPKEPPRPAPEPGETAFALAEKTKAYEAEMKVYRAKLATSEAEFTKYMRGFSKDWESINFEADPKRSSKIDLEMVDAGVSSEAVCKVVDVQGGCEKACMKVWSDVGLERVPNSRCVATDQMGGGRKERGDAFWAYPCKAEFLCSAVPSLSVNVPGLGYKADQFRIVYEKRYEGASAENLMKGGFQAGMSDIHPGDERRFPRIRRWHFDRGDRDGWVGDALWDDGFPKRVTSESK